MVKRKNTGVRASRIEQRRKHRVFVSHATADKWIAKVFCEKIEAVGVSTFRDDKDIKAGDDIPEEIRREINRCDELLVLFTPESVDRAWVIFEVGAFWGRRKSARIVPVLCHVDLDDLPDMIDKKKAISINDFDTYLTDLSGRAQKKGR